MLDNFMDLVTATKMANQRILTEAHIQRYQHHMLHYLQGISRLYPHTELLPYHHISLHLSKFLYNFGPTHSWRCFAFERYNYILQQIETNGRFGGQQSFISGYLTNG